MTYLAIKGNEWEQRVPTISNSKDYFNKVCSLYQAEIQLDPYFFIFFHVPWIR